MGRGSRVLTSLDTRKCPTQPYAEIVSVCLTTGVVHPSANMAAVALRLRPATTCLSTLAFRALPTAQRRTDSIAVSNLQLECIVGIYAHERQALQPLRIDIEMEVDTRAAAETESCATTIDYFAVATQARQPAPWHARSTAPKPGPHAPSRRSRPLTPRTPLTPLTPLWRLAHTSSCSRRRRSQSRGCCSRRPRPTRSAAVAPIAARTIDWQTSPPCYPLADQPTLLLTCLSLSPSWNSRAARARHAHKAQCSSGQRRAFGAQRWAPYA